MLQVLLLPFTSVTVPFSTAPPVPRVSAMFTVSSARSVLDGDALATNAAAASRRRGPS